MFDYLRLPSNFDWFRFSFNLFPHLFPFLRQTRPGYVCQASH